jgi:dTDP-glucose 4,6-dehydratase
VRDTCAGFHAIAKTDALIGTVTNIGMKDEITIRDLVHLIADVMGTTIHIENDDQRIRPDKSEVERLFADNSKLMAHTDWKPEYDLRSGLAATVEFLKAHMDMYKPELYTV